MSKLLSVRAFVWLLSLSVVFVTGTRASGAPVRIVSPSSLETVEGDGFASPEKTPTRIQFLIPASEFAALHGSPGRLVAWNFRADKSQTQPADWTFGDVEVWMSTTGKTSLTLTNVFDDNHGANKLLVYDGGITFHLLGTGPAPGPRAFADGPRLQTPFDYDPSQGNLLVEFVTLSGLPKAPRIDTQPKVGAGVNILLNQGSARAATGVTLNQPAVLQFEFVPEPSAFALAALALAGRSARRQSGRLCEI